MELILAGIVFVVVFFLLSQELFGKGKKKISSAKTTRNLGELVLSLAAIV
ncbi:MAG: hypothetical protein HC780_19295 [Leptolyngbyaceae cyanobacterium CSU_1_3]|nr:hypothetical protein [Leptolyngbyaceae cyanobacterium CSU_1_3]